MLPEEEVSEVGKASGNVANGWNWLLSWDSKMKEGPSKGWDGLVSCDTIALGKVLGLGDSAMEGPTWGTVGTNWDGMDSEDNGVEGSP